MSGDETEPYRHFDTEGRDDQEIIRATPVETRPLLDLEKLRASFESGPLEARLGRRQILPQRGNLRCRCRGAGAFIEREFPLRS